MRSNHWRFQVEDQQHEHVDRAVFEDLRGSTAVPLARLAVLNPTEAPRTFRVTAEQEADLWRLHARPISTTGERQLAALLVNHHARIGGPYGERLFGHQLEEDPVDRWGVGTTQPLCWLLGEQLNSRADSFPMPFGTGPGLAMVWPLVNPWQVRVSNCLEPNEDEAAASRRLQLEWSALRFPPVILVGRLAGRVFPGDRVVAYLDHPQHVWRFHHRECGEWSDQLARWLGECQHSPRPL